MSRFFMVQCVHIYTYVYIYRTRKKDISPIMLYINAKVQHYSIKKTHRLAHIAIW